MRLLLDTRDLIWLLDNSSPERFSSFRQYLHDGQHTLVLTPSTVREFASPLVKGGLGTEVSVISGLRALDQLPKLFLRESALVHEELKAALAAYKAGKEPAPVGLFVDRLDRAFVGNENGRSRFYLNFGLPECVLETFTGNLAVFGTLPSLLGDGIRAVYAANRSLGPEALRANLENFGDAVGNHLDRARLRLDPGEMPDFVTWLFENPTRCPGVRLGFEVSCQLACDVGDVPKDGDLVDFALLRAVPYVDAVTLDKRIRHYCRGALARLEKEHMTLRFSRRIFSDVGDFMDKMPLAR